MRRGELWSAAGGGPYGRKPGPVVVLQDDRLEDTESVTVCPLTTDTTEAPLLRIDVPADMTTNLSQPSRVMIDKVSTIRRSSVGTHIGRLAPDDMRRVERSLMVFLGLAG